LKKSLNDRGPFLKEERKLIDTVAERISGFILHNKLKTVFHDWQSSEQRAKKTKRRRMRMRLTSLKRLDQNLYKLIARK
jgi:hypothetical protein